jgi:class 3 adenylate cyclase
MSGELKPQLRLEIAHVLFIDIVGYSKLLIDEQKELLQELNDIVRKTDQVREAEAEDKLVRLPTGDGMALVFTNHPEAPVECALEISKALQSHPEIKLRMGIHSGAVNSIADVNDRSNVAGAGINVAQRVMDCGDAGHILLSRHVADDLAQYRRWQSHLHDLGEAARSRARPRRSSARFLPGCGRRQVGWRSRADSCVVWLIIRASKNSPPRPRRNCSRRR